MKLKEIYQAIATLEARKKDYNNSLKKIKELDARIANLKSKIKQRDKVLNQSIGKQFQSAHKLNVKI